MLSTLACLIVVTAAPPTVSLEVQSVGLSEKREARVVKRLQQEIELMGAKVGESPRVLKVNLLRVGPVLKVSSRLVEDGQLRLEAMRRGNQGTLLPPKLREILTPPQPKPEPAPVIVVQAAPRAERLEVPPPTPVVITAPDPIEDESNMGLVAGGSATLAVGALVGASAGIIGVHETLVLRDAGASRADKDRALVVGPASVGTAVAFGVISIVGTGILAAGL